MLYVILKVPGLLPASAFNKPLDFFEFVLRDDRFMVVSCSVLGMIAYVSVALSLREISYIRFIEKRLTTVLSDCIRIDIPAI